MYDIVLHKVWAALYIHPDTRPLLSRLEENDDAIFKLSPAAMKSKILLVDEHPDILDLLGQTLQSFGYNLTLAANGKEALRALRETGFDLVLLDLEKPASNGWDTLGQIITSSLSLPVIIITARSDQKGQVTQKGVAAVLEKPLDTNLLRETIQRVLEERSAARHQRHEDRGSSSVCAADARPDRLNSA